MVNRCTSDTNTTVLQSQIALHLHTATGPYIWVIHEHSWTWTPSGIAFHTWPSVKAYALYRGHLYGICKVGFGFLDPCLRHLAISTRHLYDIQEGLTSSSWSLLKGSVFPHWSALLNPGKSDFFPMVLTGGLLPHSGVIPAMPGEVRCRLCLFVVGSILIVPFSE